MSLLLLLASAFAVRPDVAVIISDELEPYQEPADAFKEAIGVPVQTINIHGREIEADVEMAALKAASPKVVFAIGAKAAYAARFRLPSTPLVYAQVHNPQRYGIRGNQTTGVHARVPTVTYLSQVQSFFPSVRSIGVIRGPMDSDAKAELQQAAQDVGITVEIREVASPREFRKAFNELVQSMDSIWLTPEREVLSPEAFRTAVQEMKRRQKPLLADTANMVGIGHHYLLLTLARERLRDAERGIAPAEQGWVLEDRLAEMLRLDRQTVRVQIYRARRQVAAHGWAGAAGIVERRPGTGQLRLGVERLQVRVV